jgi:hypothetical protein
MKGLGPNAARLLRAGDRFDPPPGARERVSRTVAKRLAATAVLASGVASETAAAGMGAAAGGAPAAIAGPWTAVLVKVVAGLVVTGAVAVTGAGVLSHDGTGAAVSVPPPARSLSPTHEPDPLRRAPATQPQPVLAEAVAPSPSGSPSSRSARTDATPAITASTSALAGGDLRFALPAERGARLAADGPPPGSSLAAEAGLLRRAHVARMSDDSARALSILDEYDRSWPRGALQEESLVERALALCELGRREDARRVARPLLLSAPLSPLGTRLRASCAGQFAVTDEPSSNDSR